MQRGFLRELGLTDTEAFVTYNFAPPCLRRAIGTLGFLHKRCLGECHPLVCAALPFAADHGVIGNFHSKALYPFSDQVFYNRRLFDRSVYAYIHIYNRLPQVVVDASSVKEFRQKLPHLARLRAITDQGDWRSSFQDLGDLMRTLHG